MASRDFEIDLLDPFGRRFEDDLQLGVAEEAVWILAVAAVGRAARGLGVGDPYRLRTEDAEEGVGRHGARADFNVVGLLEHAASLRPEALETEYDLLEGQCFGPCSSVSHAMSLFVAFP